MESRIEDGSSTESNESEQSLSTVVLVTRAQSGSLPAFEVLYARYNNQINTYLYRMVGNPGIGCELTQEAFLKAWQGLSGLRTPALFVNWLYRIATNCAHDYQRRIKHLQTVPLDTYSEESAGLSVEGPEEGVEKSELLQLALTQIAPTYRACLILYVIEGLPQQQIAQRLNIKENSVSKYVSRGKEELRQIYRRLLMEQSNEPVQTRSGQ